MQLTMHTKEYAHVKYLMRWLELLFYHLTVGKVVF